MRMQVRATNLPYLYSAPISVIDSLTSCSLGRCDILDLVDTRLRAIHLWASWKWLRMESSHSQLGILSVQCLLEERMDMCELSYYTYIVYERPSAAGFVSRESDTTERIPRSHDRSIRRKSGKIQNISLKSYINCAVLSRSRRVK